MGVPSVFLLLNIENAFLCGPVESSALSELYELPSFSGRRHEGELGGKLTRKVVGFHLRTPATDALLDEHYEVEFACFAEVAEVADEFGDAVTDVVVPNHVVLLCEGKQRSTRTRAFAVCALAIELMIGNRAL